MSEFFHAIDSGSWEKPEVFAIADELQISQGDAFLACLTMWDYFRRNSIDGTVMGVSLRNIDRQVRLPGFAAAALKAHWLEEIEGGLRQPGFLFHLHGCESLKAYRHRIRAKRSDDKKQLLEALRTIDPDLVAGLETAQENLREKRTKRESKRESKLLPDRTGEPSRAVPGVLVLNHSTASASGGCESPDCDSATEDDAELEASTPEAGCVRSETAPQHDRPASVKLIDLLKETELLRKLDAIPVTASGVQIFGRVISEDRIKREEIERSSTEFWWTWYRDQLGSKQVVLRAGNMLEAVYVLASVLAVKRLKRIDNKLALWIKWITARECSSISAMDWRQATERIARFTAEERLLHLAGVRPATAAVARSETGHKPSAETPKPDPTAAKSTRPKMTREELKRRAAELREREAAATK